MTDLFEFGVCLPDVFLDNLWPCRQGKKRQDHGRLVKYSIHAAIIMDLLELHSLSICFNKKKSHFRFDSKIIVRLLIYFIGIIFLMTNIFPGSDIKFDWLTMHKKNQILTVLTYHILISWMNACFIGPLFISIQDYNCFILTLQLYIFYVRKKQKLGLAKVCVVIQCRQKSIFLNSFFNQVFLK